MGLFSSPYTQSTIPSQPMNWQPGPYAGGYSYPGLNTGYTIFNAPGTGGGSTAFSQPSGGGGGGNAAAGWASILQSVAQYMDDSAQARAHVQNAQQNTDNEARAGYEGRITRQYQSQLQDWEARRDRHERFRALTENVSRRTPRASMPSLQRGLQFRGNEPPAPGARPSSAGVAGGSNLSGNRLNTRTPATRSR